MICATCKAEGKTSRVFDRGGTTTLLNCRPFYDEQGRHHTHDSNTTTTGYRCSNGHEWTEKSTGSCWCGWPDKKAESPSPAPVVEAEKVKANIVLVGEGSGLVQEHEPIRLTFAPALWQQRLLDVTTRLRAAVGVDDKAPLEELLEAALAKIEGTKP
jgi:hypothetical protein